MRQFWQNAKTGDLWVVELDEHGHVIGNGSAAYHQDYMHSDEIDESDIETVCESLDNDWLEEHKKEFIVFADEDKI